MDFDGDYSDYNYCSRIDLCPQNYYNYVNTGKRDEKTTNYDFDWVISLYMAWPHGSPTIGHTIRLIIRMVRKLIECLSSKKRIWGFKNYKS